MSQYKYVRKLFAIIITIFVLALRSALKCPPTLPNSSAPVVTQR